MLEDIEQEPSEKMNLGAFSLKYALIFGLIMIIYSLIINVSGLYANRMIGQMIWLIVAGMVIWTHLDFKKNNSGFMSYGQGFLSGLIVVVLGGVIANIFGIIYMSFIDPNLIKNLLITIREQTEQQYPDMSDTQIDNIMKVSEMFFKPHWMLLFGTILYSIMGLIVSLIVSIFTQKANPDPFQ